MVRRGRARGTGFRTGPHPTRPDRTRPSCRARFRGGTPRRDQRAASGTLRLAQRGARAPRAAAV